VVTAERAKRAAAANDKPSVDKSGTKIDEVDLPVAHLVAHLRADRDALRARAASRVAKPRDDGRAEPGLWMGGPVPIGRILVVDLEVALIARPKAENVTVLFSSSVPSHLTAHIDREGLCELVPLRASETHLEEPAATAPEARPAVRWVAVAAVSGRWIKRLADSMPSLPEAAKEDEATDDEGAWSDDEEGAWSDEASVESVESDADDAAVAATIGGVPTATALGGGDENEHRHLLW
jgi:hypothetical protein